MTPARIFLVDDQPEMELIVRHMARRDGHEVAVCFDVPSAWEHLTTVPPPDLVLLDINLPRLSGLELCRRLRADPKRAAVPVAVFSHWDRIEEIEAALQAGADVVLSKDLVAQPEAWQQRLTEILADLDGRPAALSLCSQKLSAPAAARGWTADQWAAALERASRQLPVQPLRPELLLLLVRRGLARVGHRLPEFDRFASAVKGAPDGLRQAARITGADAMGWIVHALGEQLRYVLGATAVEPFHKALLPAAP